MGNEELANRRHLPKMWVKQRITIGGGMQILIELRGKGCGKILCEISGM